jgi:hypothetical protein
VWDRRSAPRRARDLAGPADGRSLRQVGKNEGRPRQDGPRPRPYSGTRWRGSSTTPATMRKRAVHGDLARHDDSCRLELTGGRVHATDPTSASRTLLYDIRTHAWDPELLRLLDVPGDMPRGASLSGSSRTGPARFRRRRTDRRDRRRQQAALFGQACFEPGMVKNTYGTGCFALMRTGDHAVQSTGGLLTTVVVRAACRPMRSRAPPHRRRSDPVCTTASASCARPPRRARPRVSSARRVSVPAFVGSARLLIPARGALLGLTRG